MDPNPIKHPAVLLARTRRAVEPLLVGKGFRFEGRNKPERPLFLYIDYARGADVLRISWDRRKSNQFIGLVAELTTEQGSHLVIAETDFTDNTALRRRPTNVEAL